jgi:O-antigen ligase
VSAPARMHEPPSGLTFGEIAETDLSPLPATRRSDARLLWAFAVAGAVLGALPAADGLYSLHVWAVAGVVAVVGLVAAVATLDRRPPWAVVAAPVLLGLLGVLQLLSQAWAESTAQASLEGHRTLVYAAALGLIVLVASDTRRRLWLLGGVAAGATLVGLVTAVRLAGPHGPDLFLRSRLFEPLGYSNATAAMLLIPCWPLVAIAERVRRPALGGAAIAVAAFLASLSVLAQSRGALAALIISALVVLACVPGRLPRLGAVALVAAAVAFAWPALMDVASGADAAGGIPAVGDLRHALLMAALGALVAGVVWAVVAALVRRAGVGAVPRWVNGTVLVAVIVVAVGASVAGDLPQVASDRWHDFRTQNGIDAGSRFSTGGGNRYDFWRVAVDEWRAHPVAGVGAGNYDVDYLGERKSDEVVRQPHSFELQTLAELGLIGAALLLALGALVAGGVVAGARRGRHDPLAGGALVGALGVVTLFAAHTSADWLHLMPGLVFVALVAVAVLVGMLGDGRPVAPRRTRLAAAVVGVASVVFLTSLGAMWLADQRRDDARADLQRQPAAALENAKQAVRLDGDNTASWIALAAAEARLDRYTAARAALERAAALEPHDPQPRALLGDLATRARDRALAARSYALAAKLNPRDTTLARLAAEASR